MDCVSIFTDAALQLSANNVMLASATVVGARIGGIVVSAVCGLRITTCVRRHIATGNVFVSTSCGSNEICMNGR